MYNLHIDHQSQPSREKSTQMLARRIAERSPPDAVILTGDFNAGEDNPAVLNLVGKPSTRPAEDSKAADATQHAAPGANERRGLLRDSFRVAHPDEKVVGTFNGFKGTKNGDKIDYILISPGVEVVEAKIIYDNKDGRYPSDHFPVVAKLRLPAR